MEISAPSSSRQSAAGGGAGSSTARQTAPARSILITSTGASCEYHGDRLGEYLLQDETHNGSVSYKQRDTFDRDDCNYLYRLSEGTWAISPTLGASSDYYLDNPANTPTLPLSGWRCRRRGCGKWRDDPWLTISTTVSPPACTAITISAGPKVTTALPDYLGVFTPTGQYYRGRPLYRNNEGKYLSMRDSYVGWRVGDEANTWPWYYNPGHISSRSSVGSPCPADPRNCYNNRENVKSWRYRWSKRDWSDGDIVVTCTDHEESLDCRVVKHFQSEEEAECTKKSFLSEEGSFEPRRSSVPTEGAGPRESKINSWIIE